MSDRGRYDYDITTGNRSYGGESRGFSRNSDSIFGSGNERWDRDREMGGRPGRGWEDEDRRGGGWTRERENLGWNRDRGERMSSGWGGLAGERMRGDRDEEDRGRGGEYYGRDDRREGLPIDETNRLIASNKVEGTAVYGREGERLGSIYNFMVDKYSGKVEYAVMTYGGFLGMGQRYYPLPWRVLTYDTDRGGYRIHLSERDLRDAPSFDRSSEPRFDRRYGEHVHGYYGLPY